MPHKSLRRLSLRRRRCLAIEPLEDRTVPSTLAVTMTDDVRSFPEAVDVSLRDAVRWANGQAGPDTVTLPAGTYVLSIAGAGEDAAWSGDLDVTDTGGALTIEGAGADSTIIDAAGLDRVFDVLPNARLVLRGVTIKGGDAGSGKGGGIQNLGALTLEDCQVVGNATSTEGGGVYNGPTGTLNVTDTGFIGNSANPGGVTAGSFGGAISNRSSAAVAVITGSVFRDNVSSVGGAIFNGTNATVTSSTFQSNTAGATSSPTTPASGLGGAIYTTGGTATVGTSTFLANRAAHGGAIATSGGTTYINDSTFTGNRAESSASGNPSRGGAIDGRGKVLIGGSTFDANESAGLGGLGGALANANFMEVKNSTISGNFAGQDGTEYNAPAGGGIYSVGTLSLIHATVVYNDTRNAGVGGGVMIGYSSSGTVATSIVDSIVALNGRPANNGQDVYGQFRSAGGNLIGIQGGSSGWVSTDQVGGYFTPIDPLLAPLADNGGPTRTYALRPSSPALDRGVPTPTDTDQRGLPRPAGTAPDVGAYEFQPHPGANAAPIANDDGYLVKEDALLAVGSNLGVLANDTDADGDPLAVAVLLERPLHGSFAYRPDGSFSYRPSPDFFGVDSFRYQAYDGASYSAPATVTITVNAVNDTPVARPDSFTVAEDGTLAVTALQGVLANDTDADADPLTAATAGGPSHGTLTLNADGSLTYTPAADYNGPDSFTYETRDGRGGTAQATATIQVTAVNDAPTLDPVADVTVAEDAAAQSIALTGVGPGGGADEASQTVTFRATSSAPALIPNPTVSGTGTGRTLLFQPAANANGRATITVTVDDGVGGTTTRTFTVTVDAVNDAPVAIGESYSTDEDTTLTVAARGVLGNDTDIDGDALTVVAVASGPAHGQLTLNADGSFSYRPAVNYSGADAFTYTVSDGQGGTATATVSLTVQPVNDAPVAIGDGYAIDENSTLTVAAPGVLGNDTDADGDRLSAALVTGPANGTLALNPDGSFSYRPNDNFAGTDSFTYRVEDGSGGVATATVILTVRDRIDIKPGDATNVIDLARDKQIAVAILSDATFDATKQVVLGSLRFGRTGSEDSAVVTKKTRQIQYQYQDVNGDGRLDLVVYFQTSKTGLQVGDRTATLTGTLTDGSLLRASEVVEVRSSTKGKHR